ncbi:hypothetical protein xavtCFBP7764_02675 [Xanthomonas citri]|nr:hypothetical protein xavtCFBP7764_02675 [Xanthomonas citri]
MDDSGSAGAVVDCKQERAAGGVSKVVVAAVGGAVAVGWWATRCAGLMRGVGCWIHARQLVFVSSTRQTTRDRASLD